VSSRFLVTCWPFEGHVFPQMAIATALRRHGHEVAFYTAPAARRFIEPEGVHVFPFGAVEESHYLRVLDSERRRDGRRQSLRIQHQALRRWLVESIPGQVSDLGTIIQDWQPDALLTDLAMWGPITILWESVPIPVVLSSTFMGPLIPGPDAPAWGFGLPAPRTARARAAMWMLTKATEVAGLGLRRRVNALRAEHGLRPLGMSMSAFSGRLPLYLVGNLRELDYGRRDLPGSVHYVGQLQWHPPEEQGTAEWLDSVPAARPWVHVTEGTSHYQDPFLLKAAAIGLAGEPLEAILTTGGKRDPAEIVAAPAANVHITRWLSHRELLPRCAVVVTTGGPATVMAALVAGVPLVVVPTTWDKPDNARRVVEAGVGIRLAPKRCTPEGLRDAVREVLRDQAYAARARQVAHNLAAAPGPEGAVDLLEDLVGNHAPTGSRRQREET
jgi:MGT family glycosyltransferase